MEHIRRWGPGPLILFAFVVAFLLPLLLSARSFAADAAGTTTVLIPWGDWVAGILNTLAVLIGTAVLGLIAKLFPFLKDARTNAAVTDAINYALGAVAGAVKGQTIEAPKVSPVVSVAEQYLVANAPAVAKWLGDLARPVILAKLSALGVVPSDVTASDVNASVPPVPLK